MASIYRPPCSRRQCQAAARNGSADDRDACRAAHEKQKHLQPHQQASWAKERCRYSRPDGNEFKEGVYVADSAAAGLRGTKAEQIAEDELAGISGAGVSRAKRGTRRGGAPGQSCRSVEWEKASLIRTLLFVVKMLAVLGYIASGLVFNAELSDYINKLLLEFVATCSRHVDGSNHGYFADSVRELLTVYCVFPVAVIVIYCDPDLDVKFGDSRVTRAHTDIFWLRNGQTLVMEGAAGQACAHIVLSAKGCWVVRVRTLWQLKQQQQQQERSNKRQRV